MAQSLAQKLAMGPSHSYALIRKAAWLAADSDFNTALETKRRLQKQAGEAPDFAEGLAAFHEKRAPKFHD